MVTRAEAILTLAAGKIEDEAIAKLRENLECVLNQPPSERARILEKEAVEEYVRLMAGREVWPAFKGIVWAECGKHGRVTALDVGGYPWCPVCIAHPEFTIEGSALHGPSLKLQLEAPVNFIQIDFTISNKPEDETE